MREANVGSGARTPAPPRNLSTYQNRKVVGRYARQGDLYPAEAELFSRYSAQFRGAVLDIGIGAGRTTKVLLPRARRYLGIDYAEAMVAAARQRFPSADLDVMDMRDAPRALAGERFDAILISFNGIDYIGWEDRCALLQRIGALLAPGGVFVFSTHNLAEAAAQRAFRLRPDLRRSAKDLVLHAPPWLLRALRNRLRLRGQEKTGDGYAYVNDSGEAYSLLTTYVDLTKQADLLAAAGFSQVEILQPWLKPGSAYFSYFACQR